MSARRSDIFMAVFDLQSIKTKRERKAKKKIKEQKERQKYMALKTRMCGFMRHNWLATALNDMSFVFDNISS